MALAGTMMFLWISLHHSVEHKLMASTMSTEASHYYWDEQELRWWSFDTKKSIQNKFERIVPQLELGGVFAWGIGEDAPDFEHYLATAEEVRKIREGDRAKDEL